MTNTTKAFAATLSILALSILPAVASPHNSKNTKNMRNFKNFKAPSAVEKSMPKCGGFARTNFAKADASVGLIGVVSKVDEKAGMITVKDADGNARDVHVGSFASIRLMTPPPAPEGAGTTAPAPAPKDGPKAAPKAARPRVVIPEITLKDVKVGSEVMVSTFKTEPETKTMEARRVIVK